MKPLIYSGHLGLELFDSRLVFLMLKMLPLSSMMLLQFCCSYDAVLLQRYHGDVFWGVQMWLNVPGSNLIYDFSENAYKKPFRCLAYLHFHKFTDTCDQFHLQHSLIPNQTTAMFEVVLTKRSTNVSVFAL